MPAARATPSPELLIAHALFGGPRDRKVVRLLVDTGATVTILPPQVALAIGCDPAKARRRIAIITASGLEYLPLVTVPRVEALGCSVRNLTVACHDLPPQSTVDGLLGLDFLSRVPAFRKFRAALHLLR